MSNSRYRETKNLTRLNVKTAKRLYPALSSADVDALRGLTSELRLSIAAGDLMYLQNGWYVTHRGLLKIARRHRCHSIRVRIVPAYSAPSANRWAFKAIVQKNATGAVFEGYGDADPTNVSPLVRGSEMRVAETRAVNRALRKAYGIGLCSVEEIGATSTLVDRGVPEPPKHAPKSTHNGNGTSSTLRDRLTLLIRQHQLDPGLVKLYAADFCGVHELRNAGREIIEKFVNELASQAGTDRASLLCKLNSYAPKQEGVA
jgi:hypothetical protein